MTLIDNDILYMSQRIVGSTDLVANALQSERKLLKSALEALSIIAVMGDSHSVKIARRAISNIARSGEDEPVSQTSGSY